MRESLQGAIKAVRGLDATAISANGNTDGDAVGVAQSGANFRVAMLVLEAATITDGTYTAVPQESATSDGTYTAVPATRLQGSSAAVSASDAVATMGVIPDPVNYPYLRVRVTATSVTTGGTVSAVWLLGSPGKTPL